MKKGVIKRLLGMLFKFYPVLLPLAVICILLTAVASTIPAIFLQKVTQLIEAWQTTGIGQVHLPRSFRRSIC